MSGGVSVPPFAAGSRKAAFDDAQAALGRLGLPDMLPVLHGAGVRISRHVLGGSHSVAVYPPINSLRPVAAPVVLDALHFGRDTSLYVHLPFCETRCTFCHYTVRHYAGKGSVSQAGEDEVAAYLGALGREIGFWGARLARTGTALSSVYIGGGTPLVLEAPDLQALVRTIEDCFEILPGAEVCIEGSPLTITAPDGKDKLRLLAANGFTRLSFGAQSFDDAVLKFAGRGHRREVAIHAAEIAAQVFDNWNIDLIQGLYKGSPAEVWENLQVLAELRPAHLTWYHGRFAGRPQGDWYQSEDRHAGFESETETLLGRMLIWQGMAAMGYHRCDGNRFVRASHYTDPFKKVRTSPSRDLLGIGVSSYSHVGTLPAAGGRGGYVFRNDTGIRTYVERMASGGAPIVAGRIIDDAELLAASYATGLRGRRIEDAALRAIAARTPRLSAQYRAQADRLVACGVLEPCTDGDGCDGLRLTELGRLFEDETLALFFSPAVRRALACADVAVTTGPATAAAAAA